MKKGHLLQEYNMGIILVVIIILITTIFVVAIAKQTNKSIEGSQCYKEVLAHVQAVKMSHGNYAPPISCSIVFETLKEKDEETIEFALAERMKTCWTDWQQGKEELFTEKATYCHPCYIIDFKEKDVDISDFNKFLASTKVNGQKYSYMQYFSGNTNNEYFASEKLSENPSINQVLPSDITTENPKIILFYYTKDSDEIKEFVESIKNSAKGAVAGIVVGATGGGLIGGSLGLLCGPALFGCVPIGIKIGAVVGALAGGFVGGTISNNYPLWLSFILIRDYDEEELKNLGCDIAPATQNN